MNKFGKKNDILTFANNISEHPWPSIDDLVENCFKNQENTTTLIETYKQELTKAKTNHWSLLLLDIQNRNDTQYMCWEALAREFEIHQSDILKFRKNVELQESKEIGEFISLIKKKTR